MQLITVSEEQRYVRWFERKMLPEMRLLERQGDWVLGPVDKVLIGDAVALLLPDWKAECKRRRLRARSASGMM